MMGRGLMKFALRDSYHHGGMVDGILKLLEMVGDDKLMAKLGAIWVSVLLEVGLKSKVP